MEYVIDYSSDLHDKGSGIVKDALGVELWKDNITHIVTNGSESVQLHYKTKENQLLHLKEIISQIDSQNRRENYVQC